MSESTLLFINYMTIDALQKKVTYNCNFNYENVIYKDHQSQSYMINRINKD